MLCPEADGIVGGQGPGLVGDVRYRAPRVVVARDAGRVQRDTRHLRLSRRQRDPLVELDELGSGGIGCPGHPSISVAPAEWQSTRRCGVEPWTSPSVTPVERVYKRP